LYVPTPDLVERNRITAAFKEYEAMWFKDIAEEFGVAQHWAKIELVEYDGERKVASQVQKRVAETVPMEWSQSRPYWTTESDRKAALARVRARYGNSMRKFSQLRAKRDPTGVFVNQHMQILLDGSKN